MGQLQRALAITARLTAEYPTNPEFWYVHARVLYQQRDDVPAMDAERNVVRFNTDRKNIGDWVWSETANLYGRIGVPCSSAMRKVAADDIDRNLCQAGTALKQVPAPSGGSAIRM